MLTKSNVATRKRGRKSAQVPIVRSIESAPCQRAFDVASGQHFKTTSRQHLSPMTLVY